MRSLGSERLLAELIYQVAGEEQRVESARLAFARTPGLAPSPAYRHIAGEAGIERSDLTTCLEGMKVECREAEIHGIILQYDGDGDGKLSEEEFKQLILPATDLPIRNLALARSVPAVLAPEGVAALQKVLQAEITYQQSVERAKFDLLRKGDFTVLEAFQTLDTGAVGRVDRTRLKWFLRKHAFLPTEADLDAVFRRWDTDDDEELSYSELAEALAPRKVCQDPKSADESSEAADFPPSEKLPEPKEALAALNQSVSGDYQRSKTGLSLVKSPYWPPPVPLRPSESELSAFIDTLQEQAANIKELETLKRELALCSDFTAGAGYSLLNPHNTEEVDANSLRKALESLGIAVFAEDALFLIRRYGTNSRLSKGNHAFMVSPESYAQIANQRYESSMRPLTRSKYVDLLRLLLHIEHRNEVRRQDCAKLTEFRAEVLFASLDEEGLGYVTAKEVKTHIVPTLPGD